MASAHALNPKAGMFARAAGVNMCCDSGGFQVKVGQEDRMCPMKVVDVGNHCGQATVVLDVAPRIGIKSKKGVPEGQKPPPLQMDIDTTATTLKILARTQREYNQILLDRKRPDLGLIQAVHGLTGNQIRKWLEIVHQPDEFIGFAMASDSDLMDRATGLKDVSLLRCAAILYHDYKVRDEWFHLFKVTGAHMVPVAAFLGTFFPHLTSDSSTWLGGGQRKDYYFNQDGWFQSLNIGADFDRRDADSLANYCSCEVCSIINTFDRIRYNDDHWRVDGAYRLINAHNVLAIKQNVAHWNNLAQTSDHDSYEKEVVRVFGPTSRALKMLRYARFAMDAGPEVADHEFKR